MAVNYKRLTPTTEKTYYEENETITLETVVDTEVLQGSPHSVELYWEGRDYSEDGVLLDEQDDITCDHVLGGHGDLASIETRMEKLGIVESIQNYPRMLNPIN